MTSNSPKYTLDDMCGMIFQRGGFDYQINMFQLAISLMGAPTLNPLFQLFGWYT